MSLESKLQGKITYDAWKRVGIRAHHGINIPLFSIHTHKSCGVGEFYDLLPLIDWCAKLGMDVIQLLPLNDSGQDPSPYNALSSCALHPIYLSLHALPYSEGMEPKLESLRAFNHSKHLQYEQVYEEKLRFLRSYIKRAKEDLIKESAYQEFLTKQHWLTPYALFRVLKNKYNHIHWKHWPEDVRNPSTNQLKKLYSEHANEIEIYSIIQYLCFQQLKKVKSYAESKGVFIKGDVPILVSPDSADVWMDPTFFDFNHVAGSPPNKFDPDGQYWGFPLYNWSAMQQDHYEWWKKRLLTAAELYHMYRIDHVIGFFRLWAIPPDHKPAEGTYLPSDPAIMRVQGEKILEILAGFTDMLPIGEDLGQPPPFLSSCLMGYGIPGTKVFRWQRDWTHGETYIPYKDYEPISMTSVSTHDLDTVRLWWKNRPKEAQDYANFMGWTYEKELSPEHQLEILHDNHHSNSLFHINLLQEYLSLVPELTWEDPEDERINYPGTLKPCNWKYRYKLPLETLTTHSTFNECLKKVLS
ncbi:4-alpha-glucanotransferase [Simkania sp.]|uniref:4-alpha-glucanotransferase n=1 Tax=Simkania sp. TaxID=34094 RepID=UPI003B52202A